MNICINCKHCFSEKHPISGETHVCKRKGIQHPVTGKVFYMDCFSERLFTGTCGLEGKHYEPARIPAHDDEPRVTAFDEFAPDGRKIQ